MTGDPMAGDPMVAAVLRRLRELRPADDPLHAFAAAVLSGEATLRAAAGHPAFEAALTAAAQDVEHAPGEPPGRAVRQ
ncbi:hypothetical protein [Dactylosporangium sp. NPDC005555]|uniref:hypothetical protein n=1 Tax=Dactylosporangium sp. NPDC005555 TaxID=3154889 RepID=UPI0033B3E1FB